MQSLDHWTHLAAMGEDVFRCVYDGVKSYDFGDFDCKNSLLHSAMANYNDACQIGRLITSAAVSVVSASSQHVGPQSQIPLGYA